jgi:hypothetical protein
MCEAWTCLGPSSRRAHFYFNNISKIRTKREQNLSSMKDACLSRLFPRSLPRLRICDNIPRRPLPPTQSKMKFYKAHQLGHIVLSFPAITLAVLTAAISSLKIATLL